MTHFHRIQERASSRARPGISRNKQSLLQPLFMHGVFQETPGQARGDSIHFHHQSNP